MNRQDYVRQLLLTIQHLHDCAAFYRETVPVREEVHGKIAWQGDVVVFDLVAHKKATCCYGWSYGEPEQFITVLALPPVNSPETAVRVGISNQTKKMDRWNRM